MFELSVIRRRDEVEDSESDSARRGGASGGGTRDARPSRRPRVATAAAAAAARARDHSRVRGEHVQRERRVRAFAGAILTGSDLPVTGSDGVAALRVVEAVYRSASEQRWVNVAD